MLLEICTIISFRRGKNMKNYISVIQSYYSRKEKALEKPKRSYKKRTRDEFIAELAINNSKVELIGDFGKMNDKTMFHCLVHDIYWETTPERALKGVGCEKCHKERNKKNITKTHDQYVEELQTKNPDIIPLEKYVNAYTTILHFCKKHDIKWKTSPASVLQGCGCKECRKEKAHSSLRKTHEQYVNELKAMNPNIIVLEPYIDAVTNIAHQCLIDGYIWNTKSANILSGCGCPLCSNHIKITQEIYVARLDAQNPNLEVKSEYINMKTPISHRCKKHNIIWNLTPMSALRGAGCIECEKEKISIANTKTYEEYINILKDVNPNIIVVGNYINASTPVTHRCLIDGYEWDLLPSNGIKGVECPFCAGTIKKTHEQYVNELFMANPNVKVIEQYINAKTPILHKCLIHNIEYKTSPVSALRGGGCRKCGAEIVASKSVKSHDQYISEVALINPNIEVMEKYKGANTPIKHYCKKHDVIWTPYPTVILRGGGCSKCASEKFSQSNKKTKEQYIEELKIVNPDIILLGEYINNNTPVLHKCLIDGYEWEARPGNILSGYGCPTCNESSGERQIRQWLEHNNIDYIFQKRFDDCRDVNPLPFDFFIPKYNKLIEYDDLQHYKSIDYFGGEDAFLLRRWHDNIKDQYCDDNNIPLLRIKYDDNIDDKLKEFLSI